MRGGRGGGRRTARRRKECQEVTGLVIREVGDLQMEVGMSWKKEKKTQFLEGSRARCEGI